MTTANRKRPKTDRGRLEALRDRLQKVIDDPKTTPRDVVSASREYRQTLTALAAMAPSAAAGSGSLLDEVAARRRRRRGA